MFMPGKHTSCASLLSDLAETSALKAMSTPSRLIGRSSPGLWTPSLFLHEGLPEVEGFVPPPLPPRPPHLHMQNLSQWKQDWDELELELLGKGAFGSVVKVKNKIDGRIYAGLNEAFSTPMSSENIKYILGNHGLSGLLPTLFSSTAHDFHNTIMQAVVNDGGYLSHDQAGGNVTGIARVTNARLASNNTHASSTFRSNLQLTLNATVTKINWASVGRLTGGNAIASGVEYIDGNGDTQTANATAVILSGGRQGSPPILKRSGIGNATYLTSLGIDSVVDLPGVETLVAMQWQLNACIPCPGDPFLLNVESMQTTLGAGNLSTLESLLNATPENLQPAAPWIKGYIFLNTPDSGPSTLTWYPVNLHPLSRGSVHIVSLDGLEYPEIQYNFFQNPVDLYIMAAGAQRIQELVSAPPLSDFISGPLSPAAGVTSIDNLSEYIKAEASYTNHVMGSALLAPQEDGGVVDLTLKVYGTNYVYVVDASVIPLQPTAHSQATIYAVSEYAATLFTQ
ncbi:hypothetical protein H0H92_002970 [Tricholoma furcatifolium]|nr:hypothetical protein H0H92_002970 [Tricholoma furcatifolium]